MCINVITTPTRQHVQCAYSVSGGISNFDVYLATLRLLRTASMSIRHTICQDFISILHLNSSHVAKLAESKGWERLLLWLLTPCKSDVDNQTEAESATSETYDVVMKTIGYILWHCIISEQSEGQTRKVGVVCGCVLTLAPPT